MFSFFQRSDLMIKRIKSKKKRFRGNRKFYYKIIEGYANISCINQCIKIVSFLGYWKMCYVNRG